MWCSAGSSTSWWRGRAPPGDPEALRAAAGTGRRRRDCPPRGRQARAHRGRVGPPFSSSPSRAGAMSPSEYSTTTPAGRPRRRPDRLPSAGARPGTGASATRAAPAAPRRSRTRPRRPSPSPSCSVPPLHAVNGALELVLVHRRAAVDAEALGIRVELVARPPLGPSCECWPRALGRGLVLPRGRRRPPSPHRPGRALCSRCTRRSPRRSPRRCPRSGRAAPGRRGCARTAARACRSTAARAWRLPPRCAPASAARELLGLLLQLRLARGAEVGVAHRDNVRVQRVSVLLPVLGERLGGIGFAGAVSQQGEVAPAASLFRSATRSSKKRLRSFSSSRPVFFSTVRMWWPRAPWFFSCSCWSTSTS